MSQFVKYDRIEMWTESFGRKKHPCVLLIAGAHAPSIFWPDFFCTKLANAGYFVLRYDHRDIGYSTHFPTTNDINKPVYTLKDLADDAIRILDAYHIRQAYVVGHSMGGSIVQYLLAYYPERVLRGVSMSVSLDKPTHQYPRINEAMNKLLKNKPTGDLKKDWSGWLSSWKLLNGKLAVDEEMALTYTKCIYNRHKGDFNPAWNEIAAYNAREILITKMPKDLLLINGDEDVLSPIEEIVKFRDQFKVEILPKAGHIFFNKEIWGKILLLLLKYFKED